MLTKKMLVAALLLPLAAGGCGRGGGSGEPTSELAESSDLNALKPDLGRAYNAFSDDYLGHTCLDMSQLSAGDFQIDPPNVGTLEYKAGMDTKQVRETLKGNANAKIDMKNVKVDGYLEMENTAGSDNLSATVNLVYYAEGGRYRIKDAAASKIKLSEFGKSVKNNAAFDKKARAERCGTHYLKGFELTAAFVASLRFEFGSESEKDRFSGKLDLAIKKIKAGGELTSDDLNASTHAAVELKVFQQGGDVTELGQVLNEHVKNCTAQTPTECVEALDGIRKYMADIFPKQFKHKNADGSIEGAGEIIPTRYWIRNAEFDEIKAIDPTFDGIVPTVEQRNSLVEMRTTLNDKWLNELRDKNRVRSILQSGLVKSLDQRNKLFAIQETLDARMLTIANAIAACYKIDENIGPCLEGKKTYEETIKTQTYDESLLVILPQNFQDYCGMMKSWHTINFGHPASTTGGVAVAADPNAAEQDLDAKTRDTISAMLNIPAVRTIQGRDFQADLATDTATIWTPAATSNRTDGTPYWNCPRLGALISNMTQPVSLADKQLHNIEPLASFADTEVLDISNNRIQTGMAAIGKLEYLTTVKAQKSKIKALKGIRNHSIVQLDLTENLIQSEELLHLADMRGLETLTLTGNAGIIDLDGLAALPRLKSLWVRNTSISKEAMQRFLTTDWDKLNGSPKVYWDTAACGELKSANVAHAAQLFCDN